MIPSMTISFVPWYTHGAVVAEWLSSWLAEQEDRVLIPGLATCIFRDWIYPASKSRYDCKIAKSTLIFKTTNQPTNLDTFLFEKLIWKSCCPHYIMFLRYALSGISSDLQNKTQTQYTGEDVIMAKLWYGYCNCHGFFFKNGRAEVTVWQVQLYVKNIIVTCIFCCVHKTWCSLSVGCLWSKLKRSRSLGDSLDGNINICMRLRCSLIMCEIPT